MHAGSFESLTHRKWCVISAVGQDSKHQEWIKDQPEFDLHLIIYDNSYEKFKADTSYIVQSKGYKFKLVYEYLNNNKNILDQYDYFYIPDDDISINTKNIHRLFNYMATYQLAIAQPAISNSNYSYSHTLKQESCTIRYTNFVEIMQPCFSKAALKKVLFTFNENEHGWGIDFHWGIILDYTRKNMAVIDDVDSFHTRPVQSFYPDELRKYLQKYNLEREIYLL